MEKKKAKRLAQMTRQILKEAGSYDTAIAYCETMKIMFLQDAGLWKK